MGFDATCRVEREPIQIGAERFFWQLVPRRVAAGSIEWQAQRFAGTVVDSLLFVDAPPVFYLNIGAYRLMQRLFPALKAGGTAVLVEFGEMHKYPVLSSQLDHPEFSIHFAHLSQAAERLGFAVAYKQIVDWLFVKRDLPALATTQTYFRTISGALAGYGITLKKIGYSQQMLRQLLGDALTLNQLHVLDLRPIAERCMGLVPHDFKALVLTKPGADAMQ